MAILESASLRWGGQFTRHESTGVGWIGQNGKFTSSNGAETASYPKPQVAHTERSETGVSFVVVDWGAHHINDGGRGLEC